MRDEQAAHAAADRAEQAAIDAAAHKSLTEFLVANSRWMRAKAELDRINWGHDFSTPDRRCYKCGMPMKGFVAASIRDVCYGAFLETTKGEGN